MGPFNNSRILYIHLMMGPSTTSGILYIPIMGPSANSGILYILSIMGPSINSEILYIWVVTKRGKPYKSAEMGPSANCPTKSKWGHL